MKSYQFAGQPEPTNYYKEGRALPALLVAGRSGAPSKRGIDKYKQTTYSGAVCISPMRVNIICEGRQYG